MEKEGKEGRKKIGRKQQNGAVENGKRQGGTVARILMAHCYKKRHKEAKSGRGETACRHRTCEPEQWKENKLCDIKKCQAAYLKKIIRSWPIVSFKTFRSLFE